MNKGYGICLNEWLFNNEIRNELRLLISISSLTAPTGECFAGNKYFADKFGETTVSISNKIATLNRLGYIDLEYEKRGTQVTKRIIRLKNDFNHGYKDFYPTVKKDFKDNNTNNNINNNVNKELIDSIVEYLNKVTNKNYRSTTKSIIGIINGRINEGYKLEDFKQVVDTKYNDWKDTEYSKYLTPATLFSAKHFDKYLNQEPIKKKDKKLEVEDIYGYAN